MKKDWIVFFSQTGTEIVDIAESLGRWPDKIITNKRPENLRKINDKLLGKEIVYLPNKPSLKDYQEILNKHDDLIITLHGWLRIMPAEICNEYAIFNGHPGLITEYPELKGKDPQMRALEGKYPVMGCVLHKVTAGVDEGKVIAEERFNAFKITEEEMWKVTRDRSLYLWTQFLKTILI
jgi:folate-dependent phosphoribosylglycinamide formyltransferase PurN